MARLTEAQTNFSSGELDPTMMLRTDTGAYENGAKRLTNVQLLNTGGGARRPGLAHAATLAGKARLRQFEFDDDEAYVFAFEWNQVEIFDGTGTLLQTLTGGRWTLDMLFELTFCQLGDVLIVFHRGMRPHVIRRTSLTTFTLSDFAFAQTIDGVRIAQPYFKLMGDDVTMQASNDSGTVDLTCSAPFFQAGHVGTRIKIFDTEVAIATVVDSTHATGWVAGRILANFDVNPLRTIKNSGWVTVTLALHGLADGQSIVMGGCNDTGGFTGGQLNGTYAIDVLSKHTFRINVGAANGGITATTSVDGGGPSVWYIIDNIPVRNWSEQLFSDINGWPGCGCFHQQRLWLGGSPEVPNGLHGSEVGDYFSFDLGTAGDTDGIFIQVGQENGVSIRHLVSGKHLQIFTEVGEFYVPQGDNEQPIKPLSITTKKETPFGVGHVAPVSLDGATIFVQKSKTAVREFIYAEAERGYQSNPLSLAASHMLASPYDLAVLYGTRTRPEQYAFLVNEDGTVAVFHSARVERLAGWTRWQTEGSFVSVTVSNGVVWAVVERDGSYRLEQLAPLHTLTIDSATGYTSVTAKKVWTVATRFAGKTVNVLSRDADGAIEWSLGRFTVALDGTLTLVSAHTSIVVGLDYAFWLETLPPRIQTDQGPLLGEKKRIARIYVGLHSAQAVSVEDERMILRQVTDDPTVPPVARTGWERFTHLGYDEAPTVIITQADPLPLTVLGLILKVSA